MDAETEYRVHGPPDRYQLTVVPVRGNGYPVSQRLKRLLKFALRSCGLRSEGLVKLPAPSQGLKPGGG